MLLLWLPAGHHGLQPSRQGGRTQVGLGSLEQRGLRPQMQVGAAQPCTALTCLPAGPCASCASLTGSCFHFFLKLVSLVAGGEGGRGGPSLLSNVALVLHSVPLTQGRVFLSPPVPLAAAVGPADMAACCPRAGSFLSFSSPSCRELSPAPQREQCVLTVPPQTESVLCGGRREKGAGRLLCPCTGWPLPSSGSVPRTSQTAMADVRLWPAPSGPWVQPAVRARARGVRCVTSPSTKPHLR